VTELDQQIIELADQGLRAVDIAQRLGLTITRTCSRMSRLTMSGQMRRAIERKGSAADAKARANVMRQRYRINQGQLSDAMMQLDMAQAQWLFEQVPHGMTVAEWLVALAKDAYAEEHGDE
jgi:hypothetical protein